jgi:hypothetical protein
MGARDPILELSPYIGFNLDIGHYVAGSKGLSPIPVLEKYHDRILSLHLKDRTADGGNVVWGQGQTPIKEVLQLMRKERWKFPAKVSDVIATHHQPSQSGAPQMSSVIHVADVLAHALQPDADALQMVPPLHPACWQLLGMTPADCQQILSGVKQQHASACEILG